MDVKTIFDKGSISGIRYSSILVNSFFAMISDSNSIAESDHLKTNMILSLRLVQKRAMEVSSTPETRELQEKFITEFIACLEDQNRAVEPVI